MESLDAVEKPVGYDEGGRSDAGKDGSRTHLTSPRILSSQLAGFSPSHIEIRIGASITVALSPFAPRKERSFAERKTTLVSAPILIGQRHFRGAW